MSAKAKEVNDKFIENVAKRSGGGILGLARNFRIIDKDRSGQLDKAEFKLAMKKFRIGLTAEEAGILFDFYDNDNSGTLAFDEFLKGLRGKLSQQRRELTEQAFTAMDTDKSGTIDVDDLRGKYDVSKHPKVLTGEWTKDDAINDFLKAFEGDDGNMDSKVTMEEWMDYHAGLSANIDHDDHYGLMMARNWGIEYIPQEKLKLIITTMKDKAKQKSGNQSGGNGKQVAKKIFKFYDLDGSGRIELGEFTKAAEQFAPGFSDKELSTLFGMFDHDNSGDISYDELLNTVFETKNKL